MVFRHGSAVRIDVGNTGSCLYIDGGHKISTKWHETMPTVRGHMPTVRGHMPIARGLCQIVLMWCVGVDEHHTVALDWGGQIPQTKVQEHARTKRYSAMLEICREKKIPALMTAHHLEDQIGKKMRACLHV